METTELNRDNTDSFSLVNIYRYKFTNEFTEELFKFAKIHQYDERNTFKDSWKIWKEVNIETFDAETRRLQNIGYSGDIEEKMYKSARYYFRKKSIESKEPTKRKNYVNFPKEVLDAMDLHIQTGIAEGNFKPSDGFNSFCKENIELLHKGVILLYHAGTTDAEEIKSKVKKTYKNRYFLIIRS
jgi:hypothetical protein